MKKITHISLLLLLSIAGGLAQNQEPVQYDPFTGEPIEPIDTATSVDTTPSEQPLSIDYDPMTGLPIAAAATVAPMRAMSTRIDHIVISRMGRISAQKDFREGNWTYINTMTATGGALVAGVWTGILTESPFLVILGGVAGAYASSAIIADAKMNNNMPDKIANSTNYEKQIYQTAYKHKFVELRKKQTYAGIIIAGITGLMMAMTL